MNQSRLDAAIERKNLRGTLLEHALVCERCRLALERLLVEQEGVLQHVLAEGVYPPMKAQLELQRAHDLLGEVFRDKELSEKLFPDPIRHAQMKTALACLCWCLGHTHTADRMGGNFGRVLIDLELVLREEGYVLREIMREPPERKPPECTPLKRKPQKRAASTAMELEFGSEE